MDRDQAPHFQDLLAAVGEVMLRWGFLETAMLEALAAKGVAVPQGVAPIIVWRRSLPEVDGLEAAARIRNLLAHGLMRASVDPEDGAHVVCRDKDGTSVRIAYDDIKSATAHINTIHRRL